MSVMDLHSDPIFVELVAQTEQLWTQLSLDRATAVRVLPPHSWRYATGEMFSEPRFLEPEIGGDGRGTLRPAPPPDGYAFGFDEKARLVVRRRFASGRIAESDYFEYNAAGGGILRTYEDAPEWAPKAFGVEVWLNTGAERRIVGRTGVARARHLYRRLRSDYVECFICSHRLESRLTDHPQFGRDGVDHLFATLGNDGNPVRVEDERGGVVYEPAQGKLDELLKLLVSAMVETVPKMVAEAAGGQSLLGVCLLQGDDNSLGVFVFTDAMLVGLKRPSDVWEGTLVEAAVEPLWFESVAAADALEKIGPHLYDSAAESQYLAALAGAVVALRKVPWAGVVRAPSFVVFTASVENGVTYHLWHSLTIEDRGRLAAVGLLPSVGR
jgi:hypothetical protein